MTCEAIEAGVAKRFVADQFGSKSLTAIAILEISIAFGGAILEISEL
jgi:hypothetical protein